MRSNESLAITLFSELITIDQLARSLIARSLPKGMNLAHFAVLNYLFHRNDERTPAQLAQVFHLTRGAMTNRLARLEWAGYVHIRPDWDDARQKFVSISPAGRAARDAALAAVGPLLSGIVAEIGPQKVRALLSPLRELRLSLGDE